MVQLKQQLSTQAFRYSVFTIGVSQENNTRRMRSIKERMHIVNLRQDIVIVKSYKERLHITRSYQITVFVKRYRRANSAL
jgi:hypothetical protein